MSEKHFVVQGAECTCEFAGGGTDKLMLTANSQDYINDGDGSKKAIASTKDIMAPFEKKTFGSCSKMQGSTCVPNITKWEDFYKKITLTNGGNVLTEDSKAFCAVGGKACITIKDHGQTAGVSSAHFENVQVSTMAALNPMAEPVEKKKLEVPKVRSIKANDTKSSKTVVGMTLRPGEQVQFAVNEYYNAAKADKAKVNWKIFKGHAFSEEGCQVFAEIGPELSLSFDQLGEYRIMAYGKEGNDTSCAIDVTIALNKLKDQFSIKSTSAHAVDKGYRIRRGVPIGIRAAYQINPATADEVSQVSMQVTDAAGVLIASVPAGTDVITFTPQNAAATYVVTATMGEQQITKELVTEVNGVGAVTMSPQMAEVVRPGTTLTFMVTGMTYTTDAAELLDFEKEQIHWQLNGKEVGTGPSITLNGDMYFWEKKNYVMEAYVVKADGWDERNGQIAKRRAQNDECRFRVSFNKVTEIAEESGKTKWVIGKRYNVVASTLMPYDEKLDGRVKWLPGTSTNTRNENVYAKQAGKIFVQASLKGNDQPANLSVQAVSATIDAWYFGDKDLVYKGKAGWNETIKVVIKSPMAANTEVNVHILEADRKLGMNYIKDLGKGKFNATGVLVMDVKTNDLKKALNKLSFEDEEYDVFFAILPEQGGVAFEGLKKVKCEGKEYLFPAKESSYRGRETGKYIYINKQHEVTAVGYFDSTGHPAYKTYKYGEQIKIRVQTRNMAGRELLLEIYENRYKHDNIFIQTKTIKIDENELCELLLNTKELESGNKAWDDNYRAFYVVIKLKEWWGVGNLYQYPDHVKDEDQHIVNRLYYYQHLKLSNANADAYNKLAGQYAPAVLGEALDGNPEAAGPCPRCGDKVTADQLKKIFTTATPEHLEEIAAAYTKYMHRMNMATCYDKAHFFAQAFVESGSGLKTNRTENLNYSRAGLIVTFPQFQSEEGRQKAAEIGRPDGDDGILSIEKQKALANYAYGMKFNKATGLGNLNPGDGYLYRGRGPLQLTGRAGYTYAQQYFNDENVSVVDNPDILLTKAAYAVKSSMAFWNYKDIALVSRKKNSIQFVCKRVGRNTKAAGEKESNHEKKTNAFNNVTSKVFMVDECTYGTEETVITGDINRYKIEVNDHNPVLYQKNTTSKVYEFEVTIGGVSKFKKQLKANELNFMPFWPTGDNWGRFGPRDPEGDNYACPEMVARLLGFFYSLPGEGIPDTLYFNDISASDNTDLGHNTHDQGLDADIRYPGSGNGQGPINWTTAMQQGFNGDQDAFEAYLIKILAVAKKWGFGYNFAYRGNLGNSTYAAKHVDHFHIGLSNREILPKGTKKSKPRVKK